MKNATATATATALRQPVQYDQTLLAWVRRFAAENPAYSTKRLAEEIGCSPATLNLYLEEKYFGAFVRSNNGKLEEQIRAFRRRMDGAVRPGYAPGFVETAAFRELDYGLGVAIAERQIALLYADSGSGKTRCVTEWMRRHAELNPIYLLVSPNARCGFFANQLARKLGIEKRGTVAQLEEQMAESLRGTNRLIIVDNANYLNHDALGIVRYLWEVSNTPFALLGTRQLYQKFTAVNLVGDVVSQLSSRVAFCRRLSPLTVEELAGLVRPVMPDAGDDFFESLHTLSRGNFCAVDMLMPRLVKLAGKNAAGLSDGTIQLTDLLPIAAQNLIL